MHCTENVISHMFLAKRYRSVSERLMMVLILLTVMLLVTNMNKFGQYKMMQKPWRITETLTNGYSSESTLLELYQQDRFWMVFKNICVLEFWTKVASALKGLTVVQLSVIPVTRQPPASFNMMQLSRCTDETPETHTLIVSTFFLGWFVF